MFFTYIYIHIYLLICVFPLPCNSTEGSRSTCRRCLKPLTVGSLRLGVRSHIPLFNHAITMHRILYLSQQHLVSPFSEQSSLMGWPSYVRRGQKTTMPIVL